MSLDTSGNFLEGIRSASGNNPFTFPPRSFIAVQDTFDANITRAEYLVFAGHFDSTVFSTDIGDPSLIFYWCRNDTITRFDHDGFARRWNPSPGGAPIIIGKFGNTPRLKASVVDTTSSSPYGVYIGSPTRLVSFTVSTVPSPAEFGNPSAGVVEQAKTTGELNWGDDDINNPAYSNQNVIVTSQTFFDRTKSKGIIGTLPSDQNESFFLFLNPIPAPGQTPRIKIGFYPYLNVVEVATEVNFSAIPSGTAQWAANTGRVNLSTDDVKKFLGQNVYYDGVILGSFQLTTTDVGPAAGTWPAISFDSSALIKSSGVTDPNLYYVYVNTDVGRYYFSVKIIFSSSGSVTDPPSSGVIYLDSDTGNFYFSPFDVDTIQNGDVFVVTSAAYVDRGIAIQVFRSGVNTSGIGPVADFTIRYDVNSQIVQADIQQQFVILPTIPQVDVNLSVTVNAGPGSTGSFSGDLVDGTDPTKLGIGYALNLDQKQLLFSNRKTVNIVLDRPQSSIKLDDSVLLPSGLEVVRNGIKIHSGADYAIDTTTGVIEFTEPVGEEDPRNKLDLVGTFSLPNTFVVKNGNFQATDRSGFLFVPSGLNVGIYEISAVLSSSKIQTRQAFVAAEIGDADLRFGVEIVADRVWQNFLPPYKKFSLSRGLSINHMSLQSNSTYTVLSTNAQINLSSPAFPGEIFSVSYIWQQSSDEGVTITPTKVIEYAAFKVRQEQAQTNPGTTKVTFNSSHKTVDTKRPITIYVDGVTQDQGSFTFNSPGTLFLHAPITAEIVIVDYFVREATGGETNFVLLNNPIDVDVPIISAGKNTSQFNGNNLNVLSTGTPILIGGKEVIIISQASYDATDDLTLVVFEQAPSTDLSGTLEITQPVTGFYRITETAPVGVFSNGTNQISISGNRPYKSGMILTVDGDPYLISSVKYDILSNKTLLITAGPAKRNYVMPGLTHSVRPIVGAAVTFDTNLPASMASPFTLVLAGNDKKVLSVNTDYQIAEGGGITLQTPLFFGDILYALYVGRIFQPKGTKLNIDYAYQIAPDAINGIQGQELLMSYSLYNPDSWFYRAETFVTFLPEVISLLQQSASSTGTGGPNIQNSGSLKTKDFGAKSLFFDEQHIGNLDAVIIKLLVYYNGLVNLWEDMLSNFDGRVVGGTSGRFRFDGNLNNLPRKSYADVTNDIDDSVFLYNQIELIDFFDFSETPVYGPMWQVNNLSRIFPNTGLFSVALNGLVGRSNFQKELGSLNVSDIISAGIMSSTAASAQFFNGVGASILIYQNGDIKQLIPRFLVGQRIQIYSSDGTPDIITTILNISGTGPFTLHLASSTNLITGSLVQLPPDPLDITYHTYTPQRDIYVKLDTGQVINMFLDMPAPFGFSQVPVSGNEIVDTQLVFNNTDVAPRRIPVLDGGTLTDSGHVSVPPLFRLSELYLLDQELSSLNAVGQGEATTLTSITSATALPAVGHNFKFLEGPNAGLIRIVDTVGTTSFTLSSGLSAIDATPRNFTFYSGDGSISNILSNEIGYLSTNQFDLPTTGLIGPINSELTTLDTIIRNIGTIQAANSGVITGNIITDMTTDFIAKGVNSSSFVYIPNGPNTGLYKIDSVAVNSITINTTVPFAAFVADRTDHYVIISTWGFLGSKEYGILSKILRKTFAWYNATVTWASNVSPSGMTDRQTALNQRQFDVRSFIIAIQSLLGRDDNLYDTRYLWIQQRTDKKIGTLIQQSQATQQRVDATTKLVADQQKLLIASKLGG